MRRLTPFVPRFDVRWRDRAAGNRVRVAGEWRDVTVTRGRIASVDVGTVRIGLALSDPDQVLASPLTTVVVAGDGDPSAAADRVAQVVIEAAATHVVVGLPLTLAGREGAAAQQCRDFASALAPLVSPRVVELVDERFTTTTAHRDLAAAGRSSRRRRDVIDQAAAVVLLQHVLDTRHVRSTDLLGGVPR